MTGYNFGFANCFGFSGSSSLAQILYQTSIGDFTYNTDASGNIVLTNQGSFGTSYDALPYSGRAIELGVLNDVDIPIHHTLGADNKQTATLGTGWTDNGGHSYTGATASSSLSNLSTGTSVPSVLINFTITAYTSGSVGGYSALGTYEVESTTESLTGASFVGTVLINSVKQITNPNSYLTYYDFSKSAFVTLGNSVDGGSSEELNPTSNFGDFSAGDAGTGFVSVSEVATVTNNDSTPAYIAHSFTPTIGKTYMIVGELLSASVANAGRILFGGYDNTTVAVGGISITYTATSTSPLFLSNETATLGAVLTWGKFSIKEILPISTTYTLNTKTINNVITHTTPWSATAWTKINNNPNLVGKLALETLGATKTIPELDMVMDAGASADKWYPCMEKERAYIVNARTAYGTEKVTNGTFTTDTNWVKQAGWTIEGGVAVSNAGASIYQNIPTTEIGAYYIVSADIVSYTSGVLRINIRGTTKDISTVGTKTFILQAGASSDTIVYLDAISGFIGSIDNVSVREATATEIANYAETVRTNADLQQKGIQQTAFVTDGAGTPLSYTRNILNYDANSYTDTQWNPSLESTFWLEEVIDGVVYQHKYDGTNLTTYTDNVVGTPALHSPENASYLLGKGVYPKVTADPYTSYQSKTFQLHTGTRYTNYDQAARYAILAAL